MPPQKTRKVGRDFPLTKPFFFLFDLTTQHVDFVFYNYKHFYKKVNNY